MSFFKRTCLSLASHTLRRPPAFSSRLAPNRTIKTSGSADKQPSVFNEPIEASSSTPAQTSPSLTSLFEDIDKLTGEGFDTKFTSSFEGGESDTVDPNGYPPRAPNSDALDKREQLRKAKGARRARASPFGLRVDGVHHLHARCSQNNTILTFTNNVGNTIYQVTAGMCGFKHVQRSTYEAGYQCAVRMFEKIAEKQRDLGTVQLEIIFKGRGMGRDALQKALLMSEGNNVRRLVVQMTDATPIKIGGTRAKKARRL